MEVIGSIKFRVVSRLLVDLFGNSGDTRGTRKSDTERILSVYVNWR
jgi:hypothetical protein